MDAPVNPLKQFDDPRWWDKFDPSRPVKEYEWVVRVAKEKIALLVESAEVLDRKADGVLRYISLVMAALAGAAQFLSGKLPFYLWLLVHAPAFLLLFTAAVMAFVASRPQQMHALPELTLAFKAAESLKEYAEIRYFAFSVDLEEKLRALVDKKAKKVGIALMLLIIALAWLAVATTIAVYAGSTSPLPSPLRCCV